MRESPSVHVLVHARVLANRSRPTDGKTTTGRIAADTGIRHQSYGAPFEGCFGPLERRLGPFFHAKTSVCRPRPTSRSPVVEPTAVAAGDRPSE